MNSASELDTAITRPASFFAVEMQARSIAKVCSPPHPSAKRRGNDGATTDNRYTHCAVHHGSEGASLTVVPSPSSTRRGSIPKALLWPVSEEVRVFPSQASLIPIHRHRRDGTRTTNLGSGRMWQPPPPPTVLVRAQ